MTAGLISDYGMFRAYCAACEYKSGVLPYWMAVAKQDDHNNRKHGGNQ